MEEKDINISYKEYNSSSDLPHNYRILLEKAIEAAYKKVEKVTFGNAFCRKDIGQKALQALK